MQKVVALMLLVLLCLIIVFMRKLTKEKGGPVLNAFMEVGDFYSKLRFIFGMVSILLMLLFFYAMRSVLTKKDTKDKKRSQ